MLVFGIDPGRKGAICSLDTHTKQIRFWDMPDISSHRDVGRVAAYLEFGLRGAEGIAIEDVHSMHGMSAKSNFQFGRYLGMIEGLTRRLTPDILYIPPKSWQKLCNLKYIYPKGSTAQDKARIRKAHAAARCHELYPEAEIYGPRGGLKDGRADALLIAHAFTLIVDQSKELAYAALSEKA